MKNSSDELISSINSIFNGIPKKIIKDPNCLKHTGEDTWILITKWKGFDEEGSCARNAKRSLRTKSLVVTCKYPTISIIVNGGEKMMFRPEDHDYAIKMITCVIKGMR